MKLVAEIGRSQQANITVFKIANFLTHELSFVQAEYLEGDALDEKVKTLGISLLRDGVAEGETTAEAFEGFVDNMESQKVSDWEVAELLD